MADLLTEWAVEMVDFIFVEAESLAVSGLAVVAVGSCTLCLAQASLVQTLQLLLRHQLWGRPGDRGQRSLP